MLKVGFSKLDVTPPLGVDLGGYYQTRFAKGILDPIYLHALAINNGENTVLLITLDCCGIKFNKAKHIRKEVSKCTGIPIDNIMISALHQHTSIYIADPNDRQDIVKDEAYLDVLFRKFSDAATLAIEDMKTATMEYGEKEADPKISFSRRYFTAESGVITNPYDSYKLTVLGHCDEVDNKMRVIKFKREGSRDIAILNFPIHPDSIGTDYFSADWHYFLRRYFSEQIGNVDVLTLTGFEGDCSAMNYCVPKNERCLGLNGYPVAEWLGREMTKAALAAWNELKEISSEGLFSSFCMVESPTNLEGTEHYEESEKWLQLYDEDKIPAKERSLNNLGYHARIVNLKYRPPFQYIPITIFSIGDLMLLAFGGEPFSRYAELIRDKYPNKYILTCTLTNGCEGYIPSKMAFEQGGYEAVSSPFVPKIEADILSAVDEMIKGAN